MTLPPGRARARDQAAADRVARQREHDRDDRCRLLCREDRGSRRDDDIDLEPDELGRDLGEALAASLRPAILDRDGAALDPAEFAQPLHKSGEVHGLQAEGVPAPRNPMVGSFAGCCARAASGHARRAAEQRDEFAPSDVDCHVTLQTGSFPCNAGQDITLSARDARSCCAAKSSRRFLCFSRVDAVEKGDRDPSANHDSVDPEASAWGRVMMGRQAVDQSQLFYLFNLEQRIPADHLLRRSTRLWRRCWLISRSINAVL